MAVHLSDRNAEMRLLLILKDVVGLKVMGCRFHRGLVGGVGVTLSHKVLGVWRFEGAEFHFWRSACGKTSLSAQSPEQVIAHTVQFASSHFNGRSLD